MRRTQGEAIPAPLNVPVQMNNNFNGFGYLEQLPPYDPNNGQWYCNEEMRAPDHGDYYYNNGFDYNNFPTEKRETNENFLFPTNNRSQMNQNKDFEFDTAYGYESLYGNVNKEGNSDGQPRGRRQAQNKYEELYQNLEMFNRSIPSSPINSPCEFDVNEQEEQKSQRFQIGSFQTLAKPNYNQWSFLPAQHVNYRFEELCAGMGYSNLREE